MGGRRMATLEGKNVLLTGASGSIGGEVARRLAAAALAWLRSRRPRPLPILGASTAAQLEERLQCLSLDLPERARAPRPGKRRRDGLPPRVPRPGARRLRAPTPAAPRPGVHMTSGSPDGGASDELTRRGRQPLRPTTCESTASTRG